MESQYKQIALSEQQQLKNIAMWQDNQKLTEIRSIYAKNATDTEFAMLVGIGQATGLNPFLREIWLVKYGNGAAQIFIGRDGYRIGAQRQPDYDYHIVDAVYSNDKFAMVDGEVKHQYQITDRGRLMGAYCFVKKRSSSRAMYAYVEFTEYDLKQGLWKTKPATMIKKVAEAQAIRMAFQSTFAGTYGEEELPSEKSRIRDAEIVNIEDMANQQMITVDQVERIDSLMQLADMSFERISLGIEKIYKKKELHELTEADAKDFIRRLELRVKNDITKAEGTGVEDKAANKEDKQNEVSEAVRDIRNQATDNTNQFTEI